MSQRSSVLDGPRMGYGPVQHHPSRARTSSAMLGIICVLLAGALTLTVAGRHHSARAADAATPAVPSAAAETIAPAGVAETTSTFLNAWRLAPTDRDNTLAAVTVTGLNIDPASITALMEQRPVNDPVVGGVEEGTVHAAQTLTGGFTVQLQLLPDKAAVYGWLISSVQLG